MAIVPAASLGGHGTPGPRRAGRCGTMPEVTSRPLPAGPAVRDDAGSTEVCPGCGAVVAPASSRSGAHPGASPSCSRLFEVTLRGLREEASADVTAAATTRLADAAYDAQHPVAGEPERLGRALERLADEFGSAGRARRSGAPGAWRMTIADVAADLDVIDLGVLVGSWAQAVLADWTRAPSSAPQGSV